MLIKRLFLIFAIMPLFVTAAPVLKPGFQRVDLKEFTSLTLNILPDAGTQLIFPFMLDNPTLKPAIKIDNTNAEAFSVPATEAKAETILVDQNTITIIGNRQAGQLGNLFVNVGGYNIVIGMRTVTDVREVSPSVIFELGEEDRTHLITHTIDRYKASLKSAHDKAMQNIGRQAKEEALAYVGELVLKRPSTTPFKISKVVDLEGRRLKVYIDELVTYDSFHTVVFELDNPNSQDLRIDGISLTVIDEDEVTHQVTGQSKCPDLIEGGEEVRCTLTTLANSAADPIEYQLTISTDIGSGTASW